MEDSNDRLLVRDKIKKESMRIIFRNKKVLLEKKNELLNITLSS